MGEERAGRWKEGCGGKDRTEREGAGRAAVFLLLRTISHFTYEMNDNLGKNRMEAVFRKHRTGCPLLPARSVAYILPISLVKSDWKPQQKHHRPASPFPFRPIHSPAAPFHLPALSSPIPFSGPIPRPTSP